MPWFTCQTLWPLCYLTQKACAVSAQGTTPDHWTTKSLSISLISLNNQVSFYLIDLIEQPSLYLIDLIEQPSLFLSHRSHPAVCSVLPALLICWWVPLTSSLLVDVPSSMITITLKQFTQHASSIAFKSALKTHLFCSGLGIPCMCVLLCVCVGMDMCVLEVMRKTLNEVL